ncbi:hypothetical protein M885DRAFT_552069 [Pelagophyceae sp. CCMP2097]|nr:hypothetical protein M885DRAFT_552069 [Pelagophyceae sp. CCMP2097]
MGEAALTLGAFNASADGPFLEMGEVTFYDYDPRDVVKVVTALLCGLLVAAVLLWRWDPAPVPPPPLRLVLDEAIAALAWEQVSDDDEGDDDDTPGAADARGDFPRLLEKLLLTKGFDAEPYDDDDDDDDDASCGGDGRAARNWAVDQLGKLKSPGDATALGAAALRFLASASHLQKWEHYECVGEPVGADGADVHAAECTLALAPFVHVSLLLLGQGARPAMPVASEVGSIIVAAGSLHASTRAGTVELRSPQSAPFLQSGNRCLRAKDVALLVMVRKPR